VGFVGVGEEARVSIARGEPRTSSQPPLAFTPTFVGVEDVTTEVDPLLAAEEAQEELIS